MTVTTIPKIDRVGALGLELEEGPSIETVSGGMMGTRERVIWKSQDGTVEVGVWACDADAFQARFPFGETTHVLSGVVECAGEDGSAFTLEPGDSMVFPRGWSGVWKVGPSFRKVYTLWYLD